ncbi:hypothetical protein ABRY95_13780 [Castellaniella ginsengisoli]|uniref:Cyanophage baseplate Pam3 plug gp18 domain-containing protein n=1 Tax=Castellaniella ginsengisoli TaxID=546114 RepID=A0AB39GE12_9BURK
MIEIALRAGSANAHQRFTQRLGENLLEFRVNFLAYQEVPMWALDIYRDGAPVALGMGLCAGAVITEGYNLPADIGRLYFVGAEATLDNLGKDNHLVWLPA